jgi:hypothetical protein
MWGMDETQPDLAPRFWPLFGIALVVRVGVVILGLLLAHTPPDPYQDARTPTRCRDEMLRGPASVIEPWYRYDATWLVNLSHDGYAESRNEAGQRGVAFMPVMPAVFAASAALGLDLYWVGLILANLAGAAGATVLAQVAARLCANRDVGIRTFVLLNTFPTAFFFSAAYNESFGLLFTALAMSAWLSAKPAQCAIYAFLGSLARVTGIAVGGAALAAWLFEDRSKRGAKTAFLVAIASFAGLVLFWVYLWWATGDPLVSLDSQKKWGRHSLSIWNPWYAIESIYDPRATHWCEAFTALAFTVLGIRAWLRRGAFWGVLVLAPVAQMVMTGTFLSAHRLILAALPGFIEMGDLLRNRLAFAVTVVGFTLIQLVLLNQYIHWIFAG